MPKRALRPCRQPGCSAVVPGGGYCPRHQRERYQDQDGRRRTPAERGYDEAWRRLRIGVLRDCPACERCGAKAVLVHHRDHDPSNNARSNLESLCRRCHEREHAGKGGGSKR